MDRYVRPGMWGLELGLALLVVSGALFGGCATEQRRQEKPRAPAPALGRTPTPTMKVPVPVGTPTRALEESAIGEAPAFASVPEATRVPVPLVPAVSGSAEAAAGESEPESLVKQISASTAPNVAAGLRLIEDGRQQMREGAYDAALDRLERAVAIDPTSAYGYYFLAQVHFLKKNYDQAVAFASRAASLGRRADPAFRGRIYGLQGAVYEQVGRYPDARKAYQQALGADPQNLAARVALARLGGGQ